MVEAVALRHVARMAMRRARQRRAVGQRRQFVLGAEGIEIEGEGGGGGGRGEADQNRDRLKNLQHLKL